MPKAVRTYTSPGLHGSSVDARPEQGQSIGGIAHLNGRLNGSPTRSEDAPILPNGNSRSTQEKYPFSATDDELLMSCYGQSRRSKREVIAQLLKEHPTYPRHVITRRARRLGIAGQETHSRPWSEAEIKRLTELKKWPLSQIIEELGRSPDAVRAQLRRQRLNADFFEGWKTKDLVKDFLVTDEDVERWVRRSWIQRDHGRVTEESIHKLFREHPEEIPFDALEKEWQDFLLARPRQAWASR